MAVSDYSTTPGNNASVGGVDIAENCAPGGLNNAIRQVMADIATAIGALTASPAELNILDGATLSTAELNTLDGVTATTAQLNNASRHRQIAQGSLSGSELIIEVPSDIEGVTLDFWNYLPSTSGTVLSLQVGTGTVGSPTWVTSYFGSNILNTTSTVTGAGSAGSTVAISPAQITGEAPSSGVFTLNGFNASSALVGHGKRAGVTTGPVNVMVEDYFRTSATATHTLIRLYVTAGTMAGNYRIYGYAKP
jgi:hypothetical protein